MNKRETVCLVQATPSEDGTAGVEVMMPGDLTPAHLATVAAVVLDYVERRGVTLEDVLKSQKGKRLSNVEISTAAPPVVIRGEQG